jgi:hypothetical protein
MALPWNQIALAVAHKTGERAGLDTSNPMAMNAVFAPDREHAGRRKPHLSARSTRAPSPYSHFGSSLSVRPLSNRQL